MPIVRAASVARLPPLPLGLLGPRRATRMVPLGGTTSGVALRPWPLSPLGRSGALPSRDVRAQAEHPRRDDEQQEEHERGADVVARGRHAVEEGAAEQHEGGEHRGGELAEERVTLPTRHPRHDRDQRRGEGEQRHRKHRLHQAEVQGDGAEHGLARVREVDGEDHVHEHPGREVQEHRRGAHEGDVEGDGDDPADHAEQQQDDSLCYPHDASPNLKAASCGPRW